MAYTVDLMMKTEGDRYNKQTFIMKRLIPRLRRYYQNNKTMPDGVTIDMFRIRGFRVYEDNWQDVGFDLTREPDYEEDMRGLIKVTDVMMAFTENKQDFFDIDEIIAIGDFINTLIHTVTGLRGDIYFGDKKIDDICETQMHPMDKHGKLEASDYYERNVSKMFHFLNPSKYGKNYREMWTEFNNMGSLTNYAYSMLNNIGYKPKNIKIYCSHESNEAKIGLIVKKRDTATLSDITRAYNIFRRFVYPDIDRIYFTIVVLGRLILNQSSCPWLSDRDVTIENLSKKHTVDDGKMTFEELQKTYNMNR